MRFTAAIGLASAFLGAGIAMATDCNRYGMPDPNAYVYQVDRQVGDDPNVSYTVGEAVAMWGDRMIAGARGALTPTVPAGAAYVFVRDDDVWPQEQKLMGSDSAAGDEFGDAVAIHRRWAAATAPNHALSPLLTRVGAAYVYERNGDVWSERQKLISPNAVTDERFGSDVAIWGDTLAVSARLHDIPLGGGNFINGAGAVYVFQYDGVAWNLAQEITAFDPVASDSFGYSIALDDDVLAVAAPFDDEGDRNTGSIYVYRRVAGVWTYEAKLLAPDRDGFDYLGRRLDLSGERIIAGAHFDDDGGSATGSATIFKYDPVAGAWGFEQKLTASDGQPDDWFGRGVAIRGDLAFIGAAGINEQSGAVYAFYHDGLSWVEAGKAVGDDGSGSVWLGNAVALSDQFGVAGAMSYDAAGVLNTGAAYVFGLFADDCNGNGEWDACEWLTTGDFDNDGVIDGEDLAAYAAAAAGPTRTIEIDPPCAQLYRDAFDADDDTDVDLADMALLQTAVGS